MIKHNLIVWFKGSLIAWSMETIITWSNRNITHNPQASSTSFMSKHIPNVKMQYHKLYSVMYSRYPNHFFHCNISTWRPINKIQTESYNMFQKHCPALPLKAQAAKENNTVRKCIIQFSLGSPRFPMVGTADNIVASQFVLTFIIYTAQLTLAMHRTNILLNH
jgi:hypothetical protein